MLSNWLLRLWCSTLVGGSGIAVEAECCSLVDRSLDCTVLMEKSLNKQNCKELKINYFKYNIYLMKMMEFLSILGERGKKLF